VPARLVEKGESLADALRRRPLDEPVWTSLRRAFDEVVDQQEAHADRARPLLLMLRHEPTVRASVVTCRRRWRELLEPVVAARLPSRRGGSVPDLRAAAIVASALSCLESAQDTWADHPTSRLATLLDLAMSTVTA
jgi:hypothetical protein